MDAVCRSYDSGYPEPENTCEAPPPPPPAVCTADSPDPFNQSSAGPTQSDGVDQPPHEGSATIECDGRGGYRPQLNAWAGAKAGVEACVSKHEQSHARDWASRYPNGCKNDDGTPKPAGSDIPLDGDGYDEFLRRSECKAYTIEVPCEQAALGRASAADKPYVQGVLDDTKRQKAAFCP